MVMGIRTVLADPPWRFDNRASRAAAENHYPTMSTREICRLPVEEWVAGDALLYLWVTAAHLADGLRVLEAWGFDYVQNLVWVKVSEEGRIQIGLGNYFRHAHELCLVGKRGRPEVARHDLPTVFWAPRTQHSAKPDVFYEIVEGFSPAEPRLEMFARRPRSGWQAWGNEASWAAPGAVAAPTKAS